MREGEVERTPAKISSSGADSKWFQEDQMVLTVLEFIGRIDPCSLLICFRTVFDNVSKISRIFEIQRSLNSLHQGDKTVNSHYGEFRALWAELEILRPPTIDPKEIIKRREDDLFFGLLLMLNSLFSELIHHILRFEKLPTLNELSTMIHKEEGSRDLFQRISATAQNSHGAYQKAERKTKRCDHCKNDRSLQEQVLVSSSLFETKDVEGI